MPKIKTIYRIACLYEVVNHSMSDMKYFILGFHFRDLKYWTYSIEYAKIKPPINITLIEDVL